MEKFKWIDFDPVADGKVKPNGAVANNDNCENTSGGCQTLTLCENNVYTNECAVEKMGSECRKHPWLACGI